MTKPDLKPILANAVAAIMRPLIRFWMKKGYSFQAFEEIIRWLFVDIAEKDFQLPDKKQTDSRISVVTGLTRHQVKHYRSIPLEDSPEKAKSNRSTRVLTGWMSNEKYHDDNGPKVLDIESGENNFGDLVSEFGGDISPKAVLDDLVHQNQVEYVDKTRVKLVAKGYVPTKDEKAIIEIFGHDAAALIETLDYNLNSEDGTTRFQKKVCYDNIPTEFIDEFKKLSGKKAQKLLEELNEVLSKKQTSDDKNENSRKLGMGIYYFEQDNS